MPSKKKSPSKPDFGAFLEKALGHHKTSELDQAHMRLLSDTYVKGGVPERRAKELWNGTGPFWGRIENLTRSKQFKVFELKKVQKMLQLSPDSRLLSVGSGMGFSESFLGKHVIPKGHVIALDLSPEMVMATRKTQSTMGAKNVSVINAAASKIPLKSESVDSVISLQTEIHQLEQSNLIFREIHRVIKKGKNSRFVYSAGVCLIPK